MNLPEAYKLYANVNIVVQQNILIEHKDIVDLLCDFQMLVFEQYLTKTRQQNKFFILHLKNLKDLVLLKIIIIVNFWLFNRWNYITIPAKCIIYLQSLINLSLIFFKSTSSNLKFLLFFK